MTLQDAALLLTENGISFETQEFISEAAYWHHTSMFPCTQNAKTCRVIALIIKSCNKKKNIELQFNLVEDTFLFEEFWFGAYSFEMFCYNEDMLANDLLDHINRIQNGSFAVIVGNDLRRRRWLGDSAFDLNDDDVFGRPGFERAKQRIQKSTGFFSKFLKSRKQYEIYDWNTYQCIIK